MIFLRLKLGKSIVAVVFLLLVLSCFLFFCGGSSVFKANYGNTEERINYLRVHGWIVEGETEKKVTVPQVFSKVYEDYNTLQKRQGFDLTLFAGKEVTLYSYTVLNYPSTETVLAHLMVCDGMIIAADICSTSLNGFISVI